MSVDLLPCGSSFTEPSHYPSSLTAQATTASHSRHGSHVSAESDFSIVHSVDLDAFDPVGCSCVDKIYYASVLNCSKHTYVNTTFL